MPDPETGASLRPCDSQHRLPRPFVYPLPQPLVVSQPWTAEGESRAEKEQEWSRQNPATRQQFDGVTLGACLREFTSLLDTQASDPEWKACN